MQETGRSRSASGKGTVGVLVAALAIGVLGIASYVHAAPATTNRSKVRQVDVQSPDFNTYAFVFDNGNGTATAYAFAYMPDGSVVNGYSDATSDYSLSIEIKPGQSAKGTYSGTAHAVVDGTMTDSGGVTTPVVVTIDLAVTDATDGGAFVQQGVNAQTDPGTGERRIVRQHFRGNQSFGMTAGSLTLQADASVVQETTGGWGSLLDYDIHEVVRLR